MNKIMKMIATVIKWMKIAMIVKKKRWRKKIRRKRVRKST